MNFLRDHQLFLLFAVSLVLLSAVSHIGAFTRRLHPGTETPEEGDFAVILGSLTLLGLIIGFTFSMALTHYDQRKQCEQEEANAIASEYVRCDVLPISDSTKIRVLLRDYLEQRITYYIVRDADLLRECRSRTSQLQSNLWSAVVTPVTAQPNPVTALVLSGMSDVMDSQGNTEAAWRDRVPTAAWILVVSIAIFCTFLLGYHARPKRPNLLLALPIMISISLFIIGEIDSPRSGLIRVQAQNLEALADSLRLH